MKTELDLLEQRALAKQRLEVKMKAVEMANRQLVIAQHNYEYACRQVEMLEGRPDFECEVP